MKTLTKNKKKSPASRTANRVPSSDLLCSLQLMANQWEWAANEHDKHYALTGGQDKKAQAYSEMLRACAKELGDFVSLHNDKALPRGHESQ